MIPKANKIEKLHVVARAPFHVYFDGPADAVSGENQVGKFSILSGHADFFSMLLPGPIEIHNGDDVTLFTVNSGLITVKSNEVYVFINI